MVPGEIIPARKEITINEGKNTVTLKVTNKNKPNDVGYTQEIEISVPRTKKDGNTLVSFEYDGNTIYNNPAMGWLQYYEYTTEDVEKYWEDMDKLYEKGLKTNILYIDYIVFPLHFYVTGDFSLRDRKKCSERTN